MTDRESIHFKCQKTEMSLFQITLFRIQSYLFKANWSKELVHVVIWDYELIQNQPLKITWTQF